MSHQSDATGFDDVDYADVVQEALQSAVMAEHQASEARVLAEAGMTCALCLLPIALHEKASVFLRSEGAESEIVHDECEAGANRVARAAAMFAQFGAKGTRGLGLATVRSPRD